MYSIGEVSRRTGIPASTLRYYETIGLFPIPPKRNDGQKNGIRQYDDADLRFIDFIQELKQAGLTLQDIGVFAEDGCLSSENMAITDIDDILQKRIDIFSRHLEHVEQQMEQLQRIKEVALNKRAQYIEMLKNTPVLNSGKR